MSTIDLLLPGIFDRLSEWLEEYPDLPSAPVTEFVLARSQRGLTGNEGKGAELQALFELPPEEAEYGGLAMDPADDAWVCRADPVHLYTDVSALYLRRSQFSDLSEQDCRSLEQTINTLLAEDDVRFELSPSGAGYLRFHTAPPRLQATDPSLCLGASVFEYRPQGEDAEGNAFWTRLQSELQMLLFSSEVNERREAEGKEPINSLWLWGGASSSVEVAPVYDRVYAADNMAAELARGGGLPLAPPAAFSLPEKRGERVLWVEDGFLEAVGYDDFYAWGETIARLEEMLDSLRQALKARRIDRIRLFDGRGRCFELTRSRLWQFWRRTTLASWAMPMGTAAAEKIQ